MLLLNIFFCMRIIPRPSQSNDDDREKGEDEASHVTTPPSRLARVKDFLNPTTSSADLESYIPTFRYAPIISGLIIPFSILLEIPALTEHWYIRTEFGEIVETRENPVLLDVAMALSMACGVFANVCLVLRFLETRIKLTTLFCVFFLTIHDVINILTLIIFGTHNHPSHGLVYGQAFWTTICSTFASLVTNLTLLTDFINTPDFSHSGSGLTRKQRTLVVLVILLLSYLALGALIHSFLLDLRFIDALFFTLVSIETIGFGDIAPTTTGARIFTCAYSILGIINLALAVSLIRENILEGLEIAYLRRIRASRERHRVAETTRRVRLRWRHAIQWRLREAGQPLWAPDNAAPTTGWGLRRLWVWLVRRFRGGAPRGMRMNLDALTWEQLEGAALETGVPLSALLPRGYRGRHTKSQDAREGYPQETPLTHARLGRMAALVGHFALAMHKSAEPADSVGAEVSVDEMQGSLDGSESVSASLQSEETRAFYARFTVAWILFLVFWTVGSVIFMRTEGWEYGTAMYFCFIAFTTIGYGDYAPITPAGRSIFVAWALLGVATMTSLISVIAEAYSSSYKRAIRSSAFDHAVERFQARAMSDRFLRKSRSMPALAPTHPYIHAEQHLAALPHHVLQHARTFHEHLRYFIDPHGHPSDLDTAQPVPAAVQELMDDIVGARDSMSALDGKFCAIAMHDIPYSPLAWKEHLRASPTRLNRRWRRSRYGITQRICTTLGDPRRAPRLAGQWDRR
ncbi:hypothetical protein BD779DRAFT_1110534 [Infundibulicybe gibba]|nr:hypothetical protein BD779DRAFT_1110534 [Infundibulicybe gibba]